MAIRRALILLLPVGAAGAAGAAGPAQPGHGQATCRNPLFRCAWEGPQARAKASSLGRAPAERADLRLCPSYNGRSSCCDAAAEEATLQPAFEEWKGWLVGTLAVVQRIERELAQFSLERPGELQEASHEDAKNLHEMLRHFGGVRADAQKCFTAVLEYVAGMMCFACSPDWRQYGSLTNTSDGGQRLRVRVPDREGRAVWGSCEGFGSKANLALGAMDAVSRTRSVVSAEARLQVEQRLDMFLSAAKLQGGLYAAVAGAPVCGGPTAMEPYAAAASPRIGPYDAALEVVGEGRLSGFAVEWRAIAAAAAAGGAAASAGLGLGATVEEGPTREQRKMVRELLPWSPLLLLPLAPLLYAGVTSRHPLAQFTERYSERRTPRLRIRGLNRMDEAGANFLSPEARAEEPESP